ncbi:MAG TPA: C39 family peptidase [Candidatus Fimiplasma intestinipullorum]|uniref:C39 family peptidase n=1 Tax=Candidatus Fimiplasma intestinipullorum TaxID=2840825 RepID=A0A9D1HPG3_9FIRM|nr:C39 family peptidase [Candidatus Fimiplasma intestinipullorum]
MQHRKKRRLRKQAKVIIFLTISILIFVGIILIGRSQVHLREDGDLTFEVGQPVSLSPDDYFTLFFYSDKEKAKMAENLNVVLNEVQYVDEAQSIPAVGSYQGTLTFDGESYPITLTFEDTTSPSITCQDAFPYRDSGFDINDYVSVTDNSFEMCEVEIDTSQLNMEIPGTYEIDVHATDNYGNQTNETYQVEVKDITPPSISGTEDAIIVRGEEPDLLEGISANDNVDGDCTSGLSASGEVNNQVVGSYEVSYAVQDQNGNTGSAIKKFFVIDRETRIDDVPMVLQMPSYHNGCESASSTMLLQYYGYDVRLSEVVGAVPRMDTEWRNGTMYGADPNEAFTGSMSSTGYGVFAGPMQETMQSLIDQQQGTHTVVNLTGSSCEQLYYYINMGHPVQVWATTNMRDQKQARKVSWNVKTLEGEYTEETITFPLTEHSLVLIGYTETEVYLNDPLQGLSIVDRDSFEEAYESMGSMALIIE